MAIWPKTSRKGKSVFCYLFCDRQSFDICLQLASQCWTSLQIGQQRIKISSTLLFFRPLSTSFLRCLLAARTPAYVHSNKLNVRQSSNPCQFSLIKRAHPSTLESNRLSRNSFAESIGWRPSSSPNAFRALKKISLRYNKWRFHKGRIIISPIPQPIWFHNQGGTHHSHDFCGVCDLKSILHNKERIETYVQPVNIRFYRGMLIRMTWQTCFTFLWKDMIYLRVSFRSTSMNMSFLKKKRLFIVGPFSHNPSAVSSDCSQVPENARESRDCLQFQ